MVRINLRVIVLIKNKYINKIIADKVSQFREQIVKLKSDHKKFTASILIEETSLKVKPRTVR